MYNLYLARTCGITYIYSTYIRLPGHLNTSKTGQPKSLHTHIHIVTRMRRLYRTGIGLTTGFIGPNTITHNYSVYTSQRTIAAATLL
jgi:hypothetical protein